MKDYWLCLRGWLSGCLLAAACAPDDPKPAPVSWELVCIDVDGDGHGFQCGLGSDCDDEDPEIYEGCERSCRTPNEGCACDVSEASRACSVRTCCSATRAAPAP